MRDDGEGIDPADHEHIFQRFGRGRSEAGGGTAGLGLAIVAAVAEAHGGTVAVESELGEGSTFTIRVPTDPPPTPDGPTDDTDGTPTDVHTVDGPVVREREEAR